MEQLWSQTVVWSHQCSFPGSLCNAVCRNGCRGSNPSNRSGGVGEEVVVVVVQSMWRHASGLHLQSPRTALWLPSNATKNRELGFGMSGRLEPWERSSSFSRVGLPFLFCAERIREILIKGNYWCFWSLHNLIKEIIAILITHQFRTGNGWKNDHNKIFSWFPCWEINLPTISSR